MKGHRTRIILVLGACFGVPVILISLLLAVIYLRRPLFCNYFATFSHGAPCWHWVRNEPAMNAAHDLLLYDTNINLFIYIKGDDPSQPSTSCTQFYWPSPDEVSLTAWGRAYTIHPATNELLVICPKKPERTVPVSPADAAKIQKQITDAIVDFSASDALFDTLNRIAR